MHILLLKLYTRIGQNILLVVIKDNFRIFYLWIIFFLIARSEYKDEYSLPSLRSTLRAIKFEEITVTFHPNKT